MTRISVIVPVYNAEKYIEECLDSLVGQTWFHQKDVRTGDPFMEIILVDDCSTDGSGKIMEQYQGRYTQIKLLQTPQNSGPGGARNLGLDAAEGEYIGFVDSDDAVVPTMYEHMYEQAQAGDYDIVDAGIYYQSKDLAMVHTADEDTGEQDDAKRSHNIVSGGYLMTRIYRRSFWEESGLRFRKHAILEDMESLMYLSATAGRIGNLKEICYIYRDTQGSASKEQQAEKYHKNATQAMLAVYEKLHTLPYYEGIREAVEYTILQLYSYGINNWIARGSELPEEMIIRRLRELQQIRRQTVRGNYDNIYVQAKLTAQDIELMKWNDRI